MGFQVFTAAGIIPRDAELRVTSGGTNILSFSLGVEEGYKNKAGEWEKKTTWFNCKIFGSRGEKLAQYLTKGTRACIAGRISFSEYTNREGEKRRTTDIMVDKIEFYGGGGERQSTQAPPPQGPSRIDSDDNIPF